MIKGRIAFEGVYGGSRCAYFYAHIFFEKRLFYDIMLMEPL